MTRERGKTGTKSKPTFESVWAAIDRLVEAQKKVAEAQEKAAEARRKSEEKTAEVMREERRKTEAAQRRTEAAFESLAESQKETKERMRELTKDLHKTDGNFNNKWGRFMENLVEGDFLAVLKERGFGVRSVTPRMKSIDEHRQTKAEYDLVARDGDAVVVAEVKTTLGDRDVAKFLEKLARFKKHFSEFQGWRVLGAVAFLAVADKGSPVAKGDPPESGEADKRAQRAGLFAIRSPGGAPGLAVVENPPDFTPREF